MFFDDFNYLQRIISVEPKKISISIQRNISKLFDIFLLFKEVRVYHEN